MQTQQLQQMKHNTKSLPYFELRHHLVLITSLIIGLVLAIFSNSADASINSVSASPKTVTVPAKGIATINIVWQINRTELTTDGAGGPITQTVSVSSATAQLQLNGSTIATLGGNISSNSTLSTGQTATVSIRESLTLNTAVARRIAASSAGSLRIIRVFTDDGGTTTTSGLVNVASGSSNSGPLAVRRIDLAFENNARTDVVYKEDIVRAIADVSFRSNGLLKGEWRIVEPSASLGSSGGRVLRVVRQSLVSSGEGRTRIVSPTLPTNNNGLYLVSFVVDDTNIEIPVLRYFVLDNKAAAITTKPSELIVLSPGDGVGLDKNTTFIWQNIDGAQAYQVEIFNKHETTPLTGKLVPASESKLNLSPLAFDWLTSGNEYSWRIRAFGADGKLLAQSNLQSLFLR